MASPSITVDIIVTNKTTPERVRHGAVTADRILAGQMTIEDCIAEVISAPYVEPCPDCAAGDHQFCDGRTLDHSLDEFVPCPCRNGGHRPEESP